MRERWLGTALQLRRERAGMTQKEAAARLMYNVQKLSRMENGQLPDIHALRAMLDLYGVLWDEEAPYLELYERAADKGWWRAQSGERTGGYISLEHDAKKVWNYQARLIPGLFQLESYTRQLFVRRANARSSKWIDDQTWVRGRRRERLFGVDPLEFHALIEEQVFRFADRAQLLFINELGELPNVTVQVVLDTPEFHDGDSGTFCLLEFPYPHYPEIALNGSAARVRDSKNRTESVIAVPEWAAFINAIKHGDFENNQPN